MVKNVVLVFVLLISTASIYSLELGVKPIYKHGVVYNSELEISPSGLGLAITILDDFFIDNVNLKWETGIETSIESLGSQIVMPINLKFPFFDSEQFFLNGSIGVNPGITLSKPIPLFIIGGKIGIDLGCNITEKLILECSTNLEYATSPQYSKNIAYYSIWDISIRTGLFFII